MKIKNLIKQNYLLSLPAALILHLGRAVLFRPKVKSFNKDYDQYFSKVGDQSNEGLSSYRQRRFKKIAKIIESNGGGTVLDVAAADGSLLSYLKMNSPQTKSLYGLDISRLAVENIRSAGFSALECDLDKIDQGVLKRLGIDGKPDWIVATEVLEHVPHSEEVLLKLVRLANKGILISLPNTGYFPFRFQLLMGRFPVQWDLWPGEHLRFWTYRDFSWWLKQLGINGTPSVYFGFPILANFWKNVFAEGILWTLKPIQ